jgi:hypothetical protein
MRFIPLAIVLLSGTLHAQEGIRILSADPADNVLLEISTDTPRALLSSSDLETWNYVFHYLPPCENFKAYAPQDERSQTFFKLGPVHPEFVPLEIDTEVPSLAGKSFDSLAWNFSFSGGGEGTVNLYSFEGDDRENLSYSVLDSRPGMISVRTSIDDGHKLDHLILIPDADSAGAFQDAVIYTAERFGDLRSSTLAGDLKPFTLHRIGPETPPAPTIWPDPEGMIVEFTSPDAIVTLGADGTASYLGGGSAETVDYDYVATGRTRATLRIQRSNGDRITAFLRAFDSGAYYQDAGAPAYSISGTSGVRIVSYPTDSGE